jgi:hypothetical protein
MEKRSLCAPNAIQIQRAAVQSPAAHHSKMITKSNTLADPMTSATEKNASDKLP